MLKVGYTGLRVLSVILVLLGGLLVVAGIMDATLAFSGEYYRTERANTLTDGAGILFSMVFIVDGFALLLWNMEKIVREF